jgi:hypothetical protein
MNLVLYYSNHAACTAAYAGDGRIFAELNSTRQIVSLFKLCSEVKCLHRFCKPLHAHQLGKRGPTDNTLRKELIAPIIMLISQCGVLHIRGVKSPLAKTKHIITLR